MAFQAQAFLHVDGRKVGSTDGEKGRYRPRPGPSYSQPVAKLRGKVPGGQQPAIINVYWFLPYQVQQWIPSLTVDRLDVKRNLLLSQNWRSP